MYNIYVTASERERDFIAYIYLNINVIIQLLQSHRFFRSLNWEDVFHQRIDPPFRIPVVSVENTASLSSLIFYTEK